MVDPFDERIPRGEMAIKGAGSDARLLRNLVQAGIDAVAGEGCSRGFTPREHQDDGRYLRADD